MKTFSRFLNSTGVILDSTRSFLKFWHFYYKFLIKRFLIKMRIQYHRLNHTVVICSGAGHIEKLGIFLIFQNKYRGISPGVNRFKETLFSIKKGGWKTPVEESGNKCTLL